MIISIPRLNIKNALSFCRDIDKHRGDNRYIFDVSKIGRYEPLPMLLVSTAIRNFCDARRTETEEFVLNYNEDRTFSYACHMGFFQSFGFEIGKAPGEAMGSSTYIPLTKINICELTKIAADEGRRLDQGDIIETEAMRLSRILSQNHLEFRKIIQYLLREAIRNIPEHAETNDVWVCGQYWPSYDLAKIAILDEGIGIYNSLTRNQFHRNYITSNEDALRWALKPGISSSYSPSLKQRRKDIWGNSGYGLYMISEVSNMTNGEIVLVSGDDSISVSSEGIKTIKTDLKGTAIGVSIRPSKVINCQDIIDAARVKGEKEAQTITTAIKEASVPSKGLIKR